MDGVGGEEEAGEGGERGFQAGDAQAHPGEQYAGGRMQQDVRGVKPHRLQAEAQIVSPGKENNCQKVWISIIVYSVSPLLAFPLCVINPRIF